MVGGKDMTEEKICAHCGARHYEGWYLSELDNAYACSDDCALAIYQKYGQGQEEFDYDVMYELSGWCITI